MKNFNDLSDKQLKDLHFKLNPGADRELMLYDKVERGAMYIDVTQYIGNRIDNRTTFHIVSGAISFIAGHHSWDHPEEARTKLWKENDLYQQ